MDRAVTFDVRDGVGWITLARGDSGNTVGAIMAAELGEAVEAAERADVGVVVVTASGRFFCTGGDLREFAEAPSTSDLTEELAASLATAVRRLENMPSIVVAAVQGTAAGAGVAIAASADIIVAAEAATFTLAYTRAGLSPDGGATLLGRSLGLHRALAWALLNPSVAAHEAQQIGFVSRVYPTEGFHESVRELAATLAKGSRDAQVATKRLVRAAMPAPAEHWDAEVTRISALAGAPDGQEGIHAFLAKRAAHFPSSRGESGA